MKAKTPRTPRKEEETRIVLCSSWRFSLGVLGVLAFINSSLADPPDPKFRAQTIDDKIQIGYGVAVADVDGDAKPDILLADKKQFVWYRNPTWEKFVIAENLTKRDNVCLAAADLDGDNKCELAVGGDWDPNDRETSGAVFYMIAPPDRTQKWEPVKLHAEPTVHRMKWTKLGERDWGLIVAPLHGRGKDGTAGSRILLYHPRTDPRLLWKTELLSDSMHATHNFVPFIGGSIAVAGKEGLRVVMRDGQKPFKLPPLPRPAEAAPAGEIALGMISTASIEPMHGNQLVVYSDRRTVLTDKLVEGHALAWSQVVTFPFGDFVVGWRGGKGGVQMWSPSSNWTTTVIDDGGMACEDLCLADLNDDQKIDIIASGRATHNVKIYWNETKFGK